MQKAAGDLTENTMRRALLLSLLALGILAGSLVWLRTRPRRPTTLYIYCGTSMRNAAEELAREFEKQTGGAVEFDFGGSETLLPKLELAKSGDLFVTHDPFADNLAQKGLLERYEAVGCLVPVLVIAKGNPLQLRALVNLAKPGVRLGLMDARYSTCGQIVRERLAARGLADSVGANVKVEKRSHQDLAQDVIVGALDAALVWNFCGVLNSERVDAVWLDDPFPETHVTVCLLKCARERPAAERFLALFASESGRAVFARHGYAKTQPQEKSR
jgi:molybdate transport system substrate-binding protein